MYKLSIYVSLLCIFIYICLYIFPLHSNTVFKSYIARHFTCTLYLFVINNYHLYVYVQGTGYRKTSMQQKNQLALCYINGDEWYELEFEQCHWDYWKGNWFIRFYIIIYRFQSWVSYKLSRGFQWVAQSENH